MKTRILLSLSLVCLMGLSACHKSTCPAFDEHAGDRALKGGGKTKSGVYPKGMVKKK